MATYKVKHFGGVPLSVLDLAPIIEGGDASQSFENSADIAQHVENWGFTRYWLAEHHNMPGIGSSATSLLIGHIAGATKHIRVGSGGIMLPNHAPLVIAEQFGTLESMYPGRIDLGLGRAPGSDQATAYALRRTLHSRGEDFPEMLDELVGYFEGDGSARVRAYPGEGLKIPLWLLGSSGFSTRLAALRGLPFAFASHFAPEYTVPALELYRDHFQPSDVLKEPYSMVGVNIIAADTEEEAQWLATSQQQQFLSLRIGAPTQLKPPLKNLEEHYSMQELAIISKSLDPRSTIVGTKEIVAEKLKQFIDETGASEVIINSQIYDHNARLRSFEIVSELME